MHLTNPADAALDIRYNRRIAGSPDRRIAGSPDRRIAGSPDRRIAGSPDRRIAGSPDRPTCVRVTAMSVPAWLRRYWRPSSPPESSRTAGAGGSSRRPASSSDSLPSAAARRLRRGLSSALLCVPLLALLATGAAAQTMVPDDWPLKPSGLSAGDQFRLMFITSTTRDSASSNIADYNSFVQTRAAAGHTAIQSYSAQFRALGSTATVDARDNTSTTGTGVPIYWLGGAKVANNYADFYDGSWGSTAGRHESGGTVSILNNRVWTGSESNGTKDSNGFTLGTVNNFVRFGNATIASATIFNGLGGTSTSYPLYALSPVFEVGRSNQLSIRAPADAPEGNSGTRDLTFTVTLGTAIPSTVSYRVCFTGTAQIDTTGSLNVLAAPDYQLFSDGRFQNSNCANASVRPWKTSSTEVVIRVKGDTKVEPDETVVATLSLRGAPSATLGTSTVTHTIRNDDTPPVPTHTVWITGGPAITEGGNAVFTLHANPAPTAKLEVRLAVLDATESPISNFLQLADERVRVETIAAGNTTASFTVPTVNDGTYEPAGTVKARVLANGLVKLENGRTKTIYQRTGPDTVSVAVADNDTAPAAHVPPAVIVSTERNSASSSENVEAGDLVSFCFAVGGSFEGPRSVPTTMPRHFNVNYEIRSSSGRLVMDTGRVYENGRVYGARGIPTGTVRTLVKIDNTDLRSNAPTRVKETAATLKACTNFIRTNDMVGKTLTARVLPSFTKDYRTGTGIPTYAVGSASTATTTVILPMMSPPVVPPGGQLSTVTISADRTSVTEGGDVTFTVTADPAPARDLVVYVSAEEVMGTGDDSVIHGYSWPVRIRAGEASATWTLTTMSDDDALADGTVTGRIVSGDGYTVDTPSEVTVTLLDDDGVVTQSVPDSVVGDPATPGVDAALVAQVRGYAAETHEGQAHVDRWKRVLAAFGDDNGYTPMTAAAAQTYADKGWQRWVPVVAALEALEAAQQPLTLPAVSVAAGADVTEGGDAVFTVTASPAPAAPLAVTVTVATAGEFGVTAGSRPVTIPVTGSATLTLATANDGADEPDGSVSVTVAAGDGYTVGGPAAGTVAIADDDPAPVVATADPALVAQVRGYAAETHHGQAHVDRWRRVLAAFGDDNGYTPMTAAAAQTYADKGWQRWVPVVAALKALEAAQQPLTLPAVTVAAGADVTEGGDAVFTVTASPAPAAELAVTVTVATAGEFGITAGTQTVSIPTTGSATLTLATANDEADEPDGSVSVTVAAGNGYTVGDPAAGTVAVQDDDAPLPAITVSAGDAVTEGGDATFTVTASPAPASPLAVTVTVATEGEFGITAGSQSVTIPATGRATLTLTTTNDDADEPDGSVSVTVTAGDGYTVGDPASGTVAIADDDLPPPVVSIAATAASVTEGGGAAFTLTADRAPEADLPVTLAVAETGGGDHVAADDEGPATAVIAKGTTAAGFSVATGDDETHEPDGAVTVTLKAGEGYTVAGAPGEAATVTVTDNDAVGGAVLSVADAEVTEGEGLPVMVFTVSLSAPAPAPVQVYVSTRPSTPVSAIPKVDYAPASYALPFRAGQTEKQVYVRIYDDSHDEDPETFEVVLSKAQGATIGDGVAVGTIVNSDPMPAAWLARFGRTVAQQALDGIAGRLAAPRTPGAQGTLAGQAFTLRPRGGDDPAPAAGTSLLAGLAAQVLPTLPNGGLGAGPPSGFDPTAPGGAGIGGPATRTLTLRDILLGSSFTATGQPDAHGGSVAFWGRAAQATFEGREGTFALDGETTTAMLGTDYARDRWLLGVTLLQSLGTGGYDDRDATPAAACATLTAAMTAALPAGLCNGAVREGAGAVESTLTAAVPYAAFQASEHLKLWGAAGYGVGEVTLAPETGGTLKTDIAWTMAEVGLRGTVLAPPPAGTGPTLAVTSDALWARTTSEQVRHGLAASNSAVTRLRLGLEGQWPVVLETLGQLTPTLAVGARHDGGEAETGFGVELGGGLAWTAPQFGLALTLEGRTLLTHRDEDFQDQGVAAAFTFDPDPTTPRGPSVTLRQDWGGQATGGVDALFAADPLTQRQGTTATQSRWAAEAAWGFPAFGGRFTGSPHVGVGLAPGTRDYRLGWRLVPASPASALSLALQATRRELDAAPPEHTVGLELSTQW